MKRLLKIVFALTLILFSCKKYGNGYVKGTVTDVSTGSPAVGATINLLVEYQNAKGQSSITYTETTVTTESDGSYKISFDKKRPDWKYSYKVALGENADYIGDYEPINLNEKKTNVDFQVSKKAYAKVKMTKTTSKSCSIEFKFGVKRYEPIFGDGQTYPYTDSLFQNIFTIRGNFTSKACLTTNSGVGINYLDYYSTEQYVPIGDTAIFSIQFE